MRVLLSPKFEETPGSNPYLHLLSSGLERAGVDVVPYTRDAYLRFDFDIWHLHWPENVLLERNPVSASLKLFLRIVLAKSHGIRIVWTAHNAKPHEAHSEHLARMFWLPFSALVDGVLSLSASASDALRQYRPTLAAKIVAVTPHGHYRDVYPDSITRSEARRELGLPSECRVFLFFGQVRTYKNVELLISTFRGLGDENTRLVIAGPCNDDSLRNRIQRAGSEDPRISLALRPIEAERVQHYFRSADLMVLPFRDVLNSGSAMLALSFSLPVLTRRSGSMPELQKAVGADWMRLYDDLETHSLESAMAWAVLRDATNECSLSTFNWDRIGIDTVNAYRKLRDDKGSLVRNNHSYAAKTPGDAPDIETSA